jgi:hypothetical protein
MLHQEKQQIADHLKNIHLKQQIADHLKNIHLKQQKLTNSGLYKLFHINFTNPL